MKQAGETILEIPSSALLNPLTLASSTTQIPDYLFPRPSTSTTSGTHPTKKARTSSTTTRRSSIASETKCLNTTQLLTLYLALNRDPKSRRSSPWNKYFETLPKAFVPWHPLTWYYNTGHDGWLLKLIDMMPVSARLKLEDVKKRYADDSEVLKGVLVGTVVSCLHV